MTITSPAAANVLTYEQYMAEEPVDGRYDIIFPDLMVPVAGFFKP
jgi:hypothetical protein